MNTKRMMLGSMAGAALGAAAAFVPARAAAATSAGPRAGYFPNAVVQDQDGRQFRFYDDIVKGKRVAFSMMYASCTGICPGSTANLMTVQEMLGDRLGRDVHMVAMTLQPAFDRPAALKDYIRRYSIRPGWTFLTGAPSEMEVIRRKLGFFNSDPSVDADISQHTGMVRIGNETLDRWCMVPSLGAAKHIVRAINEI